MLDKTLILFLILFSGGLLSLNMVDLLWPRDTENLESRQEKEERMQLERLTDTMESLDYWIDTATGICYARLWAGMASGGPALAAVPCEKLTDPTPFNSEK